MKTLLRVGALFDAGTRRRFVLAIAGSIVLALAEVGAVLLVLPLMQLVLNQPSADGPLVHLKRLFGFPDAGTLAIYLAVLVFAGFLVKGVASMAIRWWTLGFINGQGVRSSEELFDYYLRAPLSLHVRRGTADLLRVINDALGQVYGQVIGGGMNIVTEAITILAMTITLLVVSPLPTVAIAVYFGLSGFLLQRWIKARAIQAGRDIVHYSFVNGQTALQGLGAIKEIKLRNEHASFVARYGHSRHRIALALRSTSFLGDLPKYALELLFILGVGIMTALVYLQDQSSGALGTLAIFAVAGFRVMPSTVRLLASINVVRGGLPALDLVEQDLIDARSIDPGDRERPSPRMPFEREVVLDGVGFAYDDHGAEAVRDVDVTIRSGTSVALVGGSGAGKSTLVDLLLGLQRPTRGRILVDGVDIADDLEGWQQNLAMVPQDIFLLDADLRDNVRFSLEVDDPDDERLHHALALAQLSDVVAELPEGVDTFLGDRGSRLSGGQRQRVGIARALFRDPSLLVLDEATSALDNETERRITDTIEGLHGQITVLVVAHRLSTVRRCDQLVYLERGRIQAVGTFDEVRASSPGFARLVELGTLDLSSADSA